MRYENLQAESVDRDYIQLSENLCKGDITLIATDELIDVTNEIRREHGYFDLVTVEDDNDVYYNFYLGFDIAKQEIDIQVTCNYGEKDDFACYTLPMSGEEKENVMFQLIGILSSELCKY